MNKDKLKELKDKMKRKSKIAEKLQKKGFKNFITSDSIIMMRKYLLNTSGIKSL